MIAIRESGSIKETLRVNIPRNSKELEDMYFPFKVIDILTVNSTIYSGEDMIEYHLIARL